jgi:hypothetical protein
LRFLGGSQVHYDWNREIDCNSQVEELRIASA